MPTQLEQTYVETAEKLGLITSQKGKIALETADTIRGNDIYADVHTVMVGRRRISDEGAEKVLAAMGQLVVYCPHCFARFAVETWDGSLKCPQDGSPIKPTLAPKALKEPEAPARKAKPASSPGTSEGDEKDPLLGRAVAGFRLVQRLEDAARDTRAYEAAMPGTGDRAVVKILMATDELTRRRFIRGAKYAGLIQNPRIISVFGAGEIAGTVYAITEFLDGQPLDKLLAAAPGQRLDAKEALRIASEVLVGLDAAHQIGVVHRNVKPAALVINHDDTPPVRIINFESSRIIDEAAASGQLTAEGQSLGTPHYMAPEQVQSSKVDHRADLYSVGATLFHMLTGHPPFHDAPSAAELMKRKFTEDIPAVSKVRPGTPPAVDHLLESLLARNPDGRYSSAAHANQAVKSITL